MKISVFILDDSPDILNSIRDVLEDSKVKDWKLFNNADDFFKDFDAEVCVIDYYLQNGLKGVDVMKRVLTLNPNCKIIMISAEPHIDVVVANYPIKFLYKLSESFGDDLVLFIETAVAAREADIKFNQLLESKLRKYEAGGS